MSAALLLAAVVGGGVLFLMRRLFPVQKAVKLLRYPTGTMRGKTVIVTGANCGIGKALAGELLKLQARVVMACRDRRSAEEAAQDIKKRAGPEQGEVVIKHLDLASLGSIRKFCEDMIAVGPDFPGSTLPFVPEWTPATCTSDVLFCSRTKLIAIRFKALLAVSYIVMCRLRDNILVWLYFIKAKRSDIFRNVFT